MNIANKNTPKRLYDCEVDHKYGAGFEGSTKSILLDHGISWVHYEAGCSVFFTMSDMKLMTYTVMTKSALQALKEDVQGYCAELLSHFNAPVTGYDIAKLIVSSEDLKLLWACSIVYLGASEDALFQACFSHLDGKSIMETANKLSTTVEDPNSLTLELVTKIYTDFGQLTMKYNEAGN
jgi:hypothetical protein